MIKVIYMFSVHSNILLDSANPRVALAIYVIIGMISVMALLAIDILLVKLCQ